jgi:hypothetical protein
MCLPRQLVLEPRFQTEISKIRILHASYLITAFDLELNCTRNSLWSEGNKVKIETSFLWTKRGKTGFETENSRIRNGVLAARSRRWN